MTEQQLTRARAIWARLYELAAAAQRWELDVGTAAQTAADLAPLLGMSDGTKLIAPQVNRIMQDPLVQTFRAACLERIESERAALQQEFDAL